MPETEYNEVRRKIHEHVYSAYLNGRSGFSRLDSPDILTDHITSLTDTTLEAYLQAMLDRPDDGFDELLLGVLNDSDTDEVAAYYLEIAKLDPQPQYAGRRQDGARGRGELLYRRARSMLLGFRQYTEGEYAPPVNILNQSDPQAAATRGLIRVTHLLADVSLPSDAGVQSNFTPSFDHYMHLTPYTLVELVLDRPDAAEDIAEFIIERETADVELIKEYLGSPSRSLKDGFI